MAICNVKKRCDLGRNLVLAPERYDPRRESLSAGASGTSVADVAACLRRTMSPNNGASGGRYLVLDTSDAREGVLVVRKEPVTSEEVGSTKKVVSPGSVVISRLRPYLRQVAFADAAIPGWTEGVELVCSTEFYVLCSKDERSVAFLVPFLLSEQVQTVLAASQEGGHHPRFDEATLLSLPLPTTILENRDEVSRSVEEGVALFRESEATLRGLVAVAQASFDANERGALVPKKPRRRAVKRPTAKKKQGS